MHRAITLATRAALVVGVLLSLIAVGQVLNVYLALRVLSPIAATLFALVVLSGVAGCAVYLGVQWYTHPPVLLAPPRTDELATDVGRHARYLVHYLDRLATNALLQPEDQQRARDGARHLADADELPADELQRVVRDVESGTVEPLIDAIRTVAEAEVRRCVRDVMAGVTLSPYRSSDLLVVLYRNGAMVVRLAELYGGRPRLAEQLAIARDTLRVVAAVNFLNFGSKLFEGILAEVPVVGRYADDAAQGIGAGFLTSAVGHAAMRRCEAFHGWDRTEAVEVLGIDSRRFLTDVRDIFFKDVYPSMRSRFGDVFDRVGIAIRAAVDASLNGGDLLIARPVMTGGRVVVRTGSGLRYGLERGTARAGMVLRKMTSRARARWTARANATPLPPENDRTAPDPPA
jgi:hypothetical protein